jgi:predicted DNA-binding transcriptional regulator AlpA
MLAAPPSNTYLTALSASPSDGRSTGIPTSSWYELQKRGLAPKPFPLTARSVGWSFKELAAWVEARKAKRADDWQQLGDAAMRVIAKSGAR